MKTVYRVPIQLRQESVSTNLQGDGAEHLSSLKMSEVPRFAERISHAMMFVEQMDRAL